MEIFARVTLAVAVCMFAGSVFGGRRVLYSATCLLAGAMLMSLMPKAPPAAAVAHEEVTSEATMIDEAAALAKRVHRLVDDVPRTKNDSLAAMSKDGEVARFYRDEQVWLTRVEHGKPLDAFVEHRASTAAIRIVAADSFLTGAVQSAIERCNDHDSALNLAMADKIIADARASLAGHGDPHFPTPDLSRQLDDSNNCINNEPAP